MQHLLTLQVNRYCIFTVQRRVHHHDHACDVKIIMTYCQSKVSPDTPRLQKQLLSARPARLPNVRLISGHRL